MGRLRSAALIGVSWSCSGWLMAVRWRLQNLVRSTSVSRGGEARDDDGALLSAGPTLSAGACFHGFELGSCCQLVPFHFSMKEPP
jgi:hypothetical protein